MKLARNFVFVALFVFSLTINVYAGDMETPGRVPPPPPPASMTASASDEVQTSSVDPSTPETSDTLLYEALGALLSLY